MENQPYSFIEDQQAQAQAELDRREEMRKEPRVGDKVFLGSAEVGEVYYVGDAMIEDYHGITLYWVYVRKTLQDPYPHSGYVGWDNNRWEVFVP